MLSMGKWILHVNMHALQKIATDAVEILIPFQKSFENRINTLCLDGVFKKAAL